MRFAFTDEQEQLRDMARKFLAKYGTTAHVRKYAQMQRGWDTETWSRVAAELGWPALAIPESYGGFGFTQVEVAAVVEEMGKTLAGAPYFSSIVLAANAILAGNDETLKAKWLPKLAAGETTATLAWLGPGSDWELSNIGTTCRINKDSDWILNGDYRWVVDGHSADRWVVAAEASGDGEKSQIALFLLDPAQTGVEVRYQPTMDTTRKLASATLRDVQISQEACLCPPQEGATALRRALNIARVQLAVEQVGTAQACLDAAVEYAKVREQFGKPIGTFQAIKHKCADMMVAVESARSAAYWAAWTAANDIEQLGEAALIAQAYASDACFDCASESVQIHGGIGFTWEHDAHLYLKRAKATQEFLGSPAAHRQRYATDVLGV